MKTRIIGKAVHWALLILVVIFLISGLAITYFRVFETITFGLLTKDAAFRIHDALWIPFTVLLILHLIFTVGRKKIRWLK